MCAPLVKLTPVWLAKTWEMPAMSDFWESYKGALLSCKYGVSKPIRRAEPLYPVRSLRVADMASGVVVFLRALAISPVEAFIWEMLRNNLGLSL